LVLLFILAIGTIGYNIIEGWSFIDSLFMTVITISTVGYDEIYPLSRAGQIFSIVLIISGVGAFFYIITTLVQYTIEGQFGIRIGRQRMEAKIKKLHNHFILCGYGRVGQAISGILKQQAIKFVVIDHDAESVNKAQNADCLTILADATKDEALKQAMIDEARGIITAFGSDADNTYVTLAARELNSTLPIIARASSSDAERKLRQAGASRVIAPETIGGHRMARLALRPAAVEFIETILFNQKQELLVEEIETYESSPLIGSTIKQIEERVPGTRVLALRKQDGSLVPNPNPTIIIEKGSSLTVFGTTKQLQALEGYCEPCEAAPEPANKEYY